MGLSVEKRGPFFTLTAWPQEGESVPLLPFLQPGNYYCDAQGDRYRILRSTVDEHRRGAYGDQETYYSWEYTAEKDD